MDITKKWRIETGSYIPMSTTELEEALCWHQKAKMFPIVMYRAAEMRLKIPLRLSNGLASLRASPRSQASRAEVYTQAKSEF